MVGISVSLTLISISKPIYFNYTIFLIYKWQVARYTTCYTIVKAPSVKIYNTYQ